MSESNTATVILTKGSNVNLTKASSGAQQFVVGLGWDPNPSNPPDLDAAAYLCDESDHIVTPVAVAEGSTDHGNFVYFHNLVSHDGAVQHSGDNLDGGGDGDDERITIDVSKLNPSVKRIAIAIAIYQGKEKSQNFGLVRHAGARVYEAGALAAAEAQAAARGTKLTDAELNAIALAKYDLEEDAGGFTASHFGTFYENNGEWKFKAMGTGVNGDLGSFIEVFSPGTTVKRA